MSDNIKSKFTAVAFFAAIANIANTIQQDKNYDHKFNQIDGNRVYALASPHAVSVTDTDSTLRYYVDFDAEQVVPATGPYNSRSTSITSFADFNNAQYIEEAMNAGCEISNTTKNHKPGILHAVSYIDSFEKHKERASSYAERFCPLSPDNV